MQQNETFKLPFFINSNAGKRKMDWFADYGPTGGKKGDFVHQILCLSDAKKRYECVTEGKGRWMNPKRTGEH